MTDGIAWIVAYLQAERIASALRDEKEGQGMEPRPSLEKVGNFIQESKWLSICSEMPLT